MWTGIPLRGLVVLHLSLILCVFIEPPALGAAGPLQLERMISIRDPEASDGFGKAIGEWNGAVLISSVEGSRVRAFDLASYLQLGEASSPEPNVNVDFGGAIAQVGDFVIVGDHQADIGPDRRVGTAYIYDAKTLEYRATLRHPEPHLGSYFGLSIAAMADRVAISAESVSGHSVYVFDPATGQLVDTIQSPASGRRFGTHLEAYDDDLFISAPGEMVDGVEAGAVYRYDGASQDVLLHITSPNPVAYGRFGQVVDVADNRLLVGGTADAAYLFDATTGELLQTFRDPEANRRDDESRMFGSSVALWQDYAIIGVPSESLRAGGRIVSYYVGAAYVYDVHTGNLVAILQNPTPGQNEHFAGDQGLNVIGDRLLIGCPWCDPGARIPGRVYVYVPEPHSSALLWGASLTLPLLRKRRFHPLTD